MLNFQRKNLIELKKQRFILALLLAWCLVQSIIFIRTGILTELEPSKYIREASNLIENHRLSSNGYIFYLTETFLIAIIKILGIPISWVVLIHLLVNLIATYYLRETIRLVTTNQIANIGALFYISFVPIQQFNFQLQTESIFLSLIIIHCYFSIRALRGERKYLMGVFILQGILLFTRPPGVLWLIPTAYVLFTYLQQSAPTKILKLAPILIIILSIATTEYILKTSNQLNLIEPFESQSVICGVPSLSTSTSISTGRDAHSIFGLLLYIKDHIHDFLKLTAYKTGSFFCLTRPYYSKTHNLFLIILIVPVYLLSALALFKRNIKRQGILQLCTIAIFVNYIMVILTCDDWHNRFFLSIYSYFILLASIGLYSLANKSKKEKTT